MALSAEGFELSSGAPLDVNAENFSNFVKYHQCLHSWVFHVQDITELNEASNMYSLFLRMPLRKRAAQQARKKVLLVLQWRYKDLVKQGRDTARYFFNRWKARFLRNQNLRANLRYTVAAVCLPSVLLSFYHLLKYQKYATVRDAQPVVGYLVGLKRLLDRNQNFQEPFPQNTRDALCVAREYYVTLTQILHAVETHCTQKISDTYIDLIEGYGKIALSLLYTLLNSVYAIRSNFANSTGTIRPHTLIVNGFPRQSRRFHPSEVEAYLNNRSVPRYTLFIALPLVRRHLEACFSLEHVGSFVMGMHSMQLRGSLSVTCDFRANIEPEGLLNLERTLAQFKGKRKEKKSMVKKSNPVSTSVGRTIFTGGASESIVEVLTSGIIQCGSESTTLRSVGSCMLSQGRRYQPHSPHPNSPA